MVRVWRFFNTLPKRSERPVSYTHLDVYKRQAKTGVMQHNEAAIAVKSPVPISFPSVTILFLNFFYRQVF